MIESNFFYKSDSDRGSHRSVTKEDFLNVLGDLEELQIRVYGDYIVRKREIREYVSVSN